MSKCTKADSKVRPRTSIFSSHPKPKEKKSCFDMLFSSHRRYSLDKQDLSTALLEGAQRFLHSKKNLKPGSKKEFSKQGETAPSMQTNIRKYQNKMTLKSDCARGAKELEKVALGRPLREVPHPLPCSALVTRAGFWKCVCLLVLGQPPPQPKPTGT